VSEVFPKVVLLSSLVASTALALCLPKTSSTVATIPPPTPSREPSVIYTHLDDGQLRFTKYLLDQRTTQDLGAVPASDPPRITNIAVLPNRDSLLASGYHTESAHPKPAAYLDWRTPALLDAKEVPQAEANPIVLNYWDGSWLLGIEETARTPGGPWAQLLFGKAENLMTVGRMRLNSTFSSMHETFQDWSPNGRFMSWSDQGQVHWLDMTNGNVGVTGKGDSVLWLPNSHGFIFWTEPPFGDHHHPIAWQVQWLLGPNAGKCMKGSRNGHPVAVSRDGRSLGVITTQFLTHRRRLVPIPGAKLDSQTRAALEGSWSIGEEGSVGYFTTPHEHDRAAGTPTRARSYDLPAQVADPRFPPPTSGRFGHFRCVVSGGFGQDWILTRFDLTSGKDSVVFRSPGRLAIRGTGDHLVLAQSVITGLLSPAAPPELSVNLFQSTDIGASWHPIATGVLAWEVSGHGAPSHLQSG
jgi:hypothetical protein